MRYHDEIVPEVGVAAAYGHAIRQLMSYFLILFVILVVSFLLASPTWVLGGIQEMGLAIIGDGDSDPANVVGGGIAFFAWMFSFFYGILILNPVKYGVYYAHLRAARNDRVKVSDMFEVIPSYIHAVLASILIWILVSIGLIFFIIPGIFLACKLAFTPYLIVDRRMSFIDAMQESWEMTRGHMLQVFTVGLASIPVMVVGLLFLVVGMIPAWILIQLAWATLYHAIECEDEIDASMYGPLI